MFFIFREVLNYFWTYNKTKLKISGKRLWFGSKFNVQKNNKYYNEKAHF